MSGEAAMYAFLHKDAGFSSRQATGMSLAWDSSDAWTCVTTGCSYNGRSGLLRGKVVVVAHTEFAGLVRVISMRKALAYEKEDFFKNTFQN